MPNICFDGLASCSGGHFHHFQQYSTHSLPHITTTNPHFPFSVTRLLAEKHTTASQLNYLMELADIGKVNKQESYNALLAHFAKNLDIANATKLMNQMEQSRMCDYYTFKNMMIMHCKARNTNQIITLLQKMKGLEIRTDRYGGIQETVRISCLVRFAHAFAEPQT